LLIAREVVITKALIVFKIVLIFLHILTAHAFERNANSPKWNWYWTCYL